MQITSWNRIKDTGQRRCCNQLIMDVMPLAHSFKCCLLHSFPAISSWQKRLIFSTPWSQSKKSTKAVQTALMVEMGELDTGEKWAEFRLTGTLAKSNALFFYFHRATGTTCTLFFLIRLRFFFFRLPTYLTVSHPNDSGYVQINLAI